MRKMSSSSSSSSSSTCRSITIRIEILILLIVCFLVVFLSDIPIAKTPKFLSPCSPPQQQQQSTPTTKTEKDYDDTNRISSRHQQSSNPTPPSPQVTSESTTQNEKKCECPSVIEKEQETESEAPTPQPSSTTTNKKKISSPPPSTTGGALNLLSMFEHEKEEYSFLSQISSSSAEKSATSIRQNLLRQIDQGGIFNMQKVNKTEVSMFTQLLLSLSKEAGKDHRQYSAFLQAMKNVATLSRVEYVQQASKGTVAGGGGKNDAGEETNKKETTADDSSESKKQVSQNRRPEKVDFLRLHRSAHDDDTMTVPSIPTDIENLEMISPTNFGLIAGFTRRSSSSSSSQKSSSTSIKVATLLTGHMRSYRRCAERLKERVLTPTDADLFIASYQDRGEKRYGNREQISHDDIISWKEVASIYSPHLRGLFVGEVPLIRRRLEIAFPNAFTNTQFSWMLYQFLLIEIGLNMTEAAWRDWDLSYETVGEMSFVGSSYESTLNSMTSISTGSLVAEVMSASSSSSMRSQLSSGVWSWANLWGSCGENNNNNADPSSCSIMRFSGGGVADSSSKKNNPESLEELRRYDVFIRLRPDLFVVGTIRLSGINLKPPMTTSVIAPTTKNEDDTTSSTTEKSSSSPATANKKLISSSIFSSFQLSLECGEEARTQRNYPNRSFAADFDDNVVLVTPHHPVYEWILDKISDLSQVATFDGARQFMPMYSYLSHLSLREQDVVFNPLCTAERLWNTRAEQLKMNQNKTFGWFAMLRNASTFRIGKNEGANSERRRVLMRKIFAITNSDDIMCPLEGGVMMTLPPKGPKKPKGGKGGRRG